MRKFLSKMLMALTMVLGALGTMGEARAGVPTQFNAQGVLRDNAGELIDLTEARITFKLYSAEAGGTVLWSETQTVAVVMGAFAAMLPKDPTTALSAEVQARLGRGEAMWLSVQLEGQNELPRTKLVSVPYAFTADRALVASAIDCTGCIDASAIDTSSLTARDLSYVPLDGGLIRATNLATALAELETYVADQSALLLAHMEDPNAHHPADSAGLHIRPESVTVGYSQLTDGTLKLGSGVNDKLTAAQVATLTGGGNADMLHTHTAQSITGMVGGSCMTAWNTTLCPAGYGAAYTGTATSMAIYDGSNYGGIGTPICANAMTHPQTNSSTFVRWVSPAPAASNVNYGHAWNQNLTMPCAVCCPAAAGAPSCIAQHSGLYPSASSSSIVIIPGTGVNNSTAYRSAPFTLASTFVNRKYRIDRMEVALTGSATAGAPSKYDLRLLDAELKVVGQWPLVHLGGRTDDQNEVQSCTNSCGYSNTASFTTYSAAIDIQYIGGTQLRMEVVDVTTGSTEVQVILVQSTCANNECAPWHKVSGCSL